ncbi:hypothetical protein R1flu_001323 [Riccia fluitans]|uniref:Uncharacterized protein n=1 Tax=Riccia fluitans TaxID=41844 RepID=A0ABD1Y2Y3_9MARC
MSKSFRLNSYKGAARDRRARNAHYDPEEGEIDPKYSSELDGMRTPVLLPNTRKCRGPESFRYPSVKKGKGVYSSSSKSNQKCDQKKMIKEEPCEWDVALLPLCPRVEKRSQSTVLTPSIDCVEAYAWRLAYLKQCATATRKFPADDTESHRGRRDSSTSE